MKTFYLPDLGEGLPDAEIHEWHVKEGDKVEIDQVLVTMETAKAVVEVPAPYAGKIVKLYGKAGDIINTGQPLVDFDSDEDKATVVGSIEVGETVIDEEPGGVAISAPSKVEQSIKVIPALRALAKKLNVDLNKLVPTGPNRSVTKEDIEKAASGTASSPDALHGARRAMAITMAHIHTNVVPVTLVDDADIHTWSEKEDVTLRVIRAIAAAVTKEPKLNSHFDGQALTMKVHSTINLGLAIDTPAGLFVPVLKDIVNKKDEQLREQINTFKNKAKANQFSPDDLHDATIVLSNFGMFAGRYANPIVVPPSVAIIGIGRLKDEVVAVDGQMKIHRIMPISITFDHRALTGGEVARFLAAFISELS